MVWIWQHDKRTDDYKIMLNCVNKLMKNKSEKEAGKGQNLKKLAKVECSSSGMSDPNKWNCNSCTVKITFFQTGLIILPSLGKLFHLIYFPKVLPMRLMVR